MSRCARLRWLVVGAAALMLAACGGGSSDSGGVNTPPPDTDSTPPSEPGSLKVSVVSATRIDLSWSASSDTGSGVAHYEIYRNDQTEPLAEVTTTSYSDRAVKPGTRYSYRVGAVDMAGNVSSLSASAAVETPPDGTSVDTTPPAAPTGLMVVNTSATQIELSWSPAVDGESGIANYRVFRNGSDVPLAAPSATTYTDDSVQPGMAYSYAITAVDTAGNESALSDAVGATTPDEAAVDSTPPSVPANVKASAKSETRIEITWSESSDAESGIIGYRLYRNGSQTARATVQGTRYLDTGLDPGKSYTYVVRAVDGAGNLSQASAQAKASTPALVDVTAPSAPTNLKAVANTATRVDLSWSAATDSESGIKAYRIFRNGSSSPLATVSGTSFIDTSVHADTQYSYAIRAVDGAGNVSNLSAAASVKTPAEADETPPSVPANVNATAKSATQVDVTWSASSDSGSGVAKYRVFRNGSSSTLATVTGTTYSDKSVAADTQYTYAVRAVDAAGNVSALSASASAKTPSASGQTSGLDVRPPNASCVAPARGSAGTGVAIERAFPNLTFKQPLGLMQAPGDSTRWFVLEREGRIKVFDNDPSVATSSTFLDVSSRVKTSGEGGLLGVAFHPKFATNHTVFVSYTRPNVSTVLRSIIARFTSPDGGATLDPNSEEVLLDIEQPQTNHNGGNIAFGPDGYLYIGLGDGGGSGDPGNNAQNTKNVLGAMLRIDINNGSPYGIPGSNPFAGNARCSDGYGSASCPEIYAWGLRNPWRWSFDKSSGDLWLADVGQATYEEVDRIKLGGNYGWRCREGFHTYKTSGPCPAGMTDPVAEYTHSQGSSITGGFVYRGKAIGDLVGRYVFGDYANGRIWKLEADSSGKFQRTQLLDTSFNIASFGQGNDGEIYAVDIASGRLHKLVPSSAGASDPVPDKLSATGCFDASDPRKPKAGLIPYAPSAPFWSDNAVKNRWLAIPDDKKITLKASGDFDFPSGSVLVKEFQLGGKRVETRLLMRHPDGVWAGYTYQWNDAQTEATRIRGGATAVYGTQTWIFPSEGQCLECHTQAAGRALGPETVQLNSDFKYPATGRTANQLATLSSIGLLSPPAADPATLEALPDPFGTAPLAKRARAYLHTNCAQCHRSGGPTPSSMDLRFDTALGSTHTCNVVPSAGDLGINDARIIAPGDPARSVLLERMQHRDANGMPPLGSNIADSKGAALLSEWIASLSGC